MKEIKAMPVPHKPKKQKRKLGLLKRNGKVMFTGGHNTTEREFLGK